MKSAGLLERSHCYVADAAAAVLLILKAGACGQAYNIADRQYQMTTREFAEQAAEAGQCVIACAQPSRREAKGYSQAERMVLDASWLEILGREPEKRNGNAIRETLAIPSGTADG